MKVIFLDIDGVLNSTRSIAGIGPSNPHHVTELGHGNWDPVAVGLLRRLVEETGAKIVISSTWRLGKEPGFFVKAFEAHGWQDAPVIGCTTWGRHESGRRGYEIANWLEGHDVDAYVIFDDDADMLDGQMKRLVQTSFNYGLCFEHYSKACEILGKPTGKILTAA